MYSEPMGVMMTTVEMYNLYEDHIHDLGSRNVAVPADWRPGATSWSDDYATGAWDDPVVAAQWAEMREGSQMRTKKVRLKPVRHNLSY